MTRRRSALLIVVLCFAAAILISGKLYTDWRVQQGQVLHPPDGQFIDIDGVRLHYVVRGEGRPVVFIHGMAGIIQDFDFGVVDSLAHDYQCVLFDRVGSGYSDILPLDSISLGTHTHYIHEAVARLGLDKPLIVGHSYGGAVALAYALWYPDDCSGLVLLAPAAYPVHKPITLAIQPLLWPAVGSFLTNTLYLPVRKLIYPFAVENAAAPDTVPTEYLRLKQLINIRPANFLTQVRELDLLDQNLQRLSPEYSRLTLPVTIITGDQDRILNPDSQAVRLSTIIRQSRLIIIPGAGHLLPQCRPAEIIPTIRAMAQLPVPTATKQD